MALLIFIELYYILSPMRLLKKGLEIELYGGTKEGKVLPLSTRLSKHFKNITQEPDERNFEYTTKPTTNYEDLFNQIILPRMMIRKYLKELDNLTLIPGSTLSLPFKKIFSPSKPYEPYHKFIGKTYKTKIITTSLHINIGIKDYETLFRLLCALRFDTPLFLALSASSCFYDGKLSGFHSYRWHIFPKTPHFIPFFTNHNEYVRWVNQELQTKKMFNVRHLWTSIRPNGPDRPEKLNRIEIRICDFIKDINQSLALVAFIETICQSYLINDEWPKIICQKKSSLDKLVKLLENQEELAAKEGLNAKIWDWRTDSQKTIQEIITSLYKDLLSTGKKLSMNSYLKPILQILETGNETTHFLNEYKKNKSIDITIQHFIREFNKMDLDALRQIKKGY